MKTFNKLIFISGAGVSFFNIGSWNTFICFFSVVQLQCAKDIVYKKDFAYPRLADLGFPQEDTSYRIKITNAEFLMSKLEDKVFIITPRENATIYRIEDIKVRGTLLFGEK